MVEFQCAVAARDRTEPIFATASQVRRWLLIEVRGAWGRRAVVDSDLARYTSQDWRGRLKAGGVRVIAIRRDLDRSSQDALHLFFVDSGGTGERGRSWTRRAATLRGAAVAATELPVDDDTEWVPHRDPLVLVCTNGRHDPCCATFGRPVVRTLRHGDQGDHVWECSHIGGDRFAANVVLLPEGLYFGRCDGDAAQRVITDYQRGAIHLDNYRGRSVLGFYEQAAEFFVRRELGLTSITAVTDIRRVEGAAGRFAVDVHDDSGPRTVGVHVARSEAAALTPLTCTGPLGQRLPAYRLVAIDTSA